MVHKNPSVARLIIRQSRSDHVQTGRRNFRRFRSVSLPAGNFSGFELISWVFDTHRPDWKPARGRSGWCSLVVDKTFAGAFSVLNRRPRGTITQRRLPVIIFPWSFQPRSAPHRYVIVRGDHGFEFITKIFQNIETEITSSIARCLIYRANVKIGTHNFVCTALVWIISFWNWTGNTREDTYYVSSYSRPFWATTNSRLSLNSYNFLFPNNWKKRHSICSNIAQRSMQLSTTEKSKFDSQLDLNCNEK